MADLGLSDREVKRVMAEADINNDGGVSYEEFIPLAIELIMSMYAKMEIEAQREAEENQAREEAQNYLLHGMTKEQVRARACQREASSGDRRALPPAAAPKTSVGPR